MGNWREEAAAIKARLAVQHLALKALVQSHPDPEEWTLELEQHRAAGVAGLEQG